jgi:tetratricopeptide (TPR) repeat protein
MSTTEYESILALAATLEGKQDWRAALEQYERAIDIDYKRPEAFVKASQMLLDNDGIWEGNRQVVDANLAVRYLKDALEWIPDSLQLVELLFHAQMHVGRLDEAVQTASTLIDLSSEKEYWQERGRDTLASLQEMPQRMNLLKWSVGTEGIDQLRRKFAA